MRRAQRRTLVAKPQDSAGGGQHQQHRKPVERLPAPAILQKARHEARRGGGAENQQVVERLGLAALVRAVAGRHQRGGADEQEIPADAVDGEGDPEIPFGQAGERRDHAGQHQHNAAGHHRRGAEPVDQIAGEERRHEHAQHMHEDDPMGFRMRKSAADDGQRRRAHDEGHRAERQHAGHRRRDEARLAGDHQQRTRRHGDFGLARRSKPPARPTGS